MPVTVYHFGPSAFVGLLLRRWLDVPVFVLVNVAVDLEVIVMTAFPMRNYPVRYMHTLLFGAVVGALWGCLMIPLKGAFQRFMHAIRLRYRPSSSRMIASGVLGAWFHILIDGLYRTDAGLFWPLRWKNPLCRFGKNEVEWLCILGSVAALTVYAFIRAGGGDGGVS